MEDEDEKSYLEDNTVGRGPQVNDEGEPIQPGEPDFVQLQILRSRNDETKKLLENWEACNFKPAKLAELLSIPGSEVTPNSVSQKISRETRKMRVQELTVILADQFGLGRANEAAEDILDHIDVLCQQPVADYPQTWAEAIALELRPKVRRVKEDAPRSKYWQALRHLSRLWSVDKSVEYAGQPFKATVIVPQRDLRPVACHRAFREVVSRYQETSVASDGGLQAINYEKACTRGHATKASSFVRPSNSDFICDVEIQAKRCLTEVELRYFNRYYKSCAVVVDPEDAFCLKEHIASFAEKYRASAVVIDNRVRTKLGARLITVGISPFSEYVREVDTRQPKLKERVSGMAQTIRACAEDFEDESVVLTWPVQNGSRLGLQPDGTYNLNGSADEPENSIADRIEEFEHAITAIQLAQILQCSRREIYKLVEQGRLPALRLGTMIRLDPAQVAAWVRSKMTIAA